MSQKKQLTIKINVVPLHVGIIPLHVPLLVQVRIKELFDSIV